MLIIIIAIVLALIILFAVKAKGQKAYGNFENINVAEFKDLLKQDNVVILDVRTQGEIAGGKIKDALEIDVLKSGFTEKAEELDKSKTYLVYCRSGRRSANACKTLSGMGFDKVYNLSGGYNSWPK